MGPRSQQKEWSGVGLRFGVEAGGGGWEWDGEGRGEVKERGAHHNGEGVVKVKFTLPSLCQLTQNRPSWVSSMK